MIRFILDLIGVTAFVATLILWAGIATGGI